MIRKCGIENYCICFLVFTLLWKWSKEFLNINLKCLSHRCTFCVNIITCRVDATATNWYSPKCPNKNSDSEKFSRKKFHFIIQWILPWLNYVWYYINCMYSIFLFLKQKLIKGNAMQCKKRISPCTGKTCQILCALYVKIIIFHSDNLVKYKTMFPTLFL